MDRRSFLGSLAATVATASAAKADNIAPTVTGEFIVNHYLEHEEELLDLPRSEVKRLIPEILEYVNARNITKSQAKNLREFSAVLEAHLFMDILNGMASGPNQNTILWHGGATLNDGRCFGLLVANKIILVSERTGDDLVS